MSTGQIDENGVFQTILQLLRELKADDLAAKIERVVGRGIIVENEAISKNAKLLRPMQPRESLAVALEFVVTNLQPPLMIEDSKIIFGCDDVKWLPDEPLIRGQSPNIQPMPNDLDLAELRKQLKAVWNLARELNIIYPEVV